jgi:hypothetical protein
MGDCWDAVDGCWGAHLNGKMKLQTNANSSCLLLDDAKTVHGRREAGAYNFSAKEKHGKFKHTSLDNNKSNLALYKVVRAWNTFDIGDIIAHCRWANTTSLTASGSHTPSFIQQFDGESENHFKMAGIENSQTPRVPAWKRLGLKLAHQDDSKKRKLDDSSSDQTQSNMSLKRKKSVTFAQDVKDDDGSLEEKIVTNFIEEQRGGPEQFTPREAARFTIPSSHPANLKPGKVTKSTESKKEKSKPREERDPSTDNLSEYLRYLIQFGTDKANWKFKKHDQTLILKYTFSERRIPSQYFDHYLEYIDGLQGQARQRLAIRAKGVLDEPEANDTEQMEDPKTRQEARDSAMKRQLLDTKIRIRESQDDEDLDNPDCRDKYTKRKRAEEILKRLADVNAMLPVLNKDAANEEVAPANHVVSTRSAPGASANPGKRQRLRIKKARTGVPEDDLSSVSSVELGSIPKRAKVKESQNDVESNSSSDSDDSSSDSDSSSSGESTSGSSSGDSEADTDDSSSSDSDSD